MLQWLYRFVISVCSKCFFYFRRMLQQVLHVASVFISRCGKRAQAEAVPVGAAAYVVAAGMRAGVVACVVAVGGQHA